ncbi:S9 family peptidase [Flavobacterium aquatile]|uniref:Peptidase S9 n=1 Tax=Flavobacterium aquatile LMG 4008 = ATCC 11947 TaxID=1453498 RepID=A0A095SYE8_9FLAO|nr:DPP IV N-terminal domain-containing protein [Flavobacterium aquatile]KGD69731.1 peptidase S9 [Flavobacterium aquatile LMG 4008 = ATCC 11947]OXA65274.1 S9 family peptidase [Flavobacterium aquatile] [Flavobacterium aquatile LMG 4008 = ATCC 11947]GEC77785.1 peptidase S9 [Flavobacterium aquatile]
MNKKIIVFFSLFLAFTSQAQLKKITLEDGVLQQGRKFGADRLTGFQWIPNSNKYVYYTDGWSKMVTATTSDKKTFELVTLAEINSALGTKLKNFFGLQWIDASTIIVSENGNYYLYSLTSKSGKKIQDAVENAENLTFDKANQNLAFTEGNNLYFLNKNKEKIAVTSNTDKNIVSGQTISRSEFGISGGIFWSPKASLLAFYQKDETEVADYPLLDVNETPGKLVSIKYPMIGQKSEKPKVGIYNLATGKTVFIAPRNNSEDYLTNLSWTPDEKYILIAELNRGQNDMCLNLYDANSGKFIKTLLNETNPKWVEPEHDAFFPSSKSNNFVWHSEKDGFQNLYYYTIDGKLIKQLTNNKFVTRDIIGTNPAGTEIYFKATGPNPTNMLVYKVDLKGKQTLITKDEGVHNVTISSDGNWFFDEYSNHSTPSKSVLYDKNLKATTLLESKNKYDGYEMGSAEIKTIKAADGTTDLYTRLIKPSNFDPNKKYPVMVYVYGGPHAQMISNSYLDGANLWMYWMAEQGYLVFTVDNRGSDNRGFAFESVIHGKCGTNEIEDQMKGVEYLKSLPYVDGNRLAVHGWSYGGFMTNSLMLRKPDAFKVGVAGGPVVDWKWYEAMYGERYMDTPAENAKGFEESSLLTYVKDLKGKLLLIHGTNDDVVVEQHNLSLVKKFVEAGKQVDYFPYPMHKHNVIGKDRVHLMTKVLNYIIDNNK